MLIVACGMVRTLTAMSQIRYIDASLTGVYEAAEGSQRVLPLV